MKTKQTTKLWGAAFDQTPSEAVISFTAGRDVVGLPPADAALVPYDLWVNKAHCVMLAKTGIIPVSDGAKLLIGLKELDELVERENSPRTGLRSKPGTGFTLDPAKEDVHTNIESWLTAKLGIGVAGRLHTARSRNDQILTDMKLYLRDQALVFISNTIGLAQTLLMLADQHKGVPMPGFTHHQHAMVTTFGHVLAGFASMVIRDIARFQGWFRLHNFNPLGNAVAFGTSFPVDRTLTASLLAFDGPDHNSMDAITNRWEPEADLVFAISVMLNHLSSLAETIILLATPEFGMLTVSDAYSTGSSIMPQKKNPDTLEVIKGKAAYVTGQLVGLMGLGKGNFTGYNRDSQWAKYIVMDCVNECALATVVMKGVLETMTVNQQAMEAWCHKGFIGATMLMEHIIQESQIPLREAKVMVEKRVKASAGQDKISTTISLATSYGGPGKGSMNTSLKNLNKLLASHKLWLLKKQKEKEAAKALLHHMIAFLTKEAT